MPSPAARRLPAGALALLLAAGLAPAASPILSSISPHGGPRGADVTLTFGGQNLGDAVEVLALEPGIAVTKVEPNAAGNAVTVAVKIAPDCRLGEHGFRLRCKGGVSDLRTFWVGTLPTVDEKEPNSEFLKPQPVPLNSTVHGKIDNEDVDYYAVPCKKGQRLSVALEGIRLGATQLWDPAVAILDSKRFELATSDDHPLAAQDCLCSAIVPADGTYVVAVREASYAAGSNYRLHVGTFPTPHAVIPAGGRPGEELTVRFLGDPAGEIQQKVKLPKEADSRFRVHCETADGVCPVGFRFRVLDLPNVTESGSNTSAATATVGSAPGAFHGVIAKPGESRCFKFAAKKGQAFELNCHARMLGSPLDPVLYVGKASGGTIAGDDDSGGGPDSLIRFNVPEDGDYVITVVDHLKAGGPNYFFRVEVAPAPAFAQVTIPRVDGNNPQNQERQALAIPRGGRFATLATVTRQNVGGAMALTLDGLPAGVSVAADALDAGQSNLPVVLEAKADAPLAAGLARFTAAPADGKPAAFESRTLLEACFAPGQNNQPYWKFDQPRVAAAVVEEAPYSIEVLEPKAAVPQNGSMNLKIRAVRKGDFKGAISIQPLWTPPGMGIAGAGTIAEGQTETTLAMNANGNAPAKKWKTAVLASAATPKGVVWTSSQLFALEVSPPLVGLEMQRAATEQGQPSSVFAKVTVNAPFPGEATVKLLGLPAKVAAPDQKLKADTKELTFPVTTAKESPAGKHGVFCQVVVTLNGEEVAQSAGSAELRIDVPIPPKAAPVAAAKPAEPAKPAAPKPAEPKRLSRLEQLRLEQEAKEKGGK